MQFLSRHSHISQRTAREALSMRSLASAAPFAREIKQRTRGRGKFDGLMARSLRMMRIA